MSHTAILRPLIDRSVKLFVPTTLVPKIVALLCLVALSSIANAAELKVLSASALRSAMTDLAIQFENSSTHKLAVNFGAVGALADRLQKGEATDVAIVSGTQIDELQKQGKIVIGSRVDLARVGVAVFVRASAAKPDISSVDAFKRSLLAAKSIAYTNPAGGGASGIYMASLVERLGIAAELRPKTKVLPPGGPLVEAIASGDAEIGIAQLSDFIAERRVELVGPLPDPIQNYTLFAAGIGASSGHQDTAKAFITFLSSPSAVRTFKEKRFVEPR